MQDRRALNIEVSVAKIILPPSFQARNKYMDVYDPILFARAKEGDCSDATPPFDRSVHLLLRKSIQSESVLPQKKAILTYGPHHDYKLQSQSLKLMMLPQKS
mmetsp:Transcript_6846/g.10690  ORF Transcript_6846/g.10690 Transcript_6846/m.10690 type:complete len:102 (+) Transcript_6846:735-1040(+)